MEQNHFSNITIIKDYQKIDRIVYGELKWKQLCKELNQHL
jgi:hypothetical protein